MCHNESVMSAMDVRKNMGTYGGTWGYKGGHGDVGEGGERGISVMPLGSHQWPVLSQRWTGPWSQEGTGPARHEG